MEKTAASFCHEVSMPQCLSTRFDVYLFQQNIILLLSNYNVFRINVPLASIIGSFHAKSTHEKKSMSIAFVQISCTCWLLCHFTWTQISDQSAKWCGRHRCIIFGRGQPTESGRMYRICYIFHIFQHVAMNLVSLERAFDSLSIDTTHDTLWFMTLILTLTYLCALWNLTHFFGKCPFSIQLEFFWYVTTRL